MVEHVQVLHALMAQIKQRGLAIVGPVAVAEEANQVTWKFRCCSIGHGHESLPQMAIGGELLVHAFGL